jgi:hypothetical protein
MAKMLSHADDEDNDDDESSMFLVKNIHEISAGLFQELEILEMT